MEKPPRKNAKQKGEEQAPGMSAAAAAGGGGHGEAGGAGRGGGGGEEGGGGHGSDGEGEGGKQQQKQQGGPNEDALGGANKEEGAPGSDAIPAAAAAAATATGGGGTAVEGAGAEGGTDAAVAAAAGGSGKPRRKRGTITEVLTATTAARLRERLEQMQVLREGVKQLGSGWERDRQLARPGKEMPEWWGAGHDVELAKGVVKHGFGSWGAIFEVRGGCRRGGWGGDGWRSGMRLLKALSRGRCLGGGKHGLESWGEYLR